MTGRVEGAPEQAVGVPADGQVGGGSAGQVGGGSAGTAGRRRRRRGLWWGLLAAVLVLAGGYAALAAWAGQRVPAETSVLGVRIGGLDEAAARARLEHALEERGPIPLQLRTPDGATVAVDSARAGLGVDARATVAGLTGFSLLPGDIWARLTGGGAEPARVRADRAALQAAIQATSAQVNRPVREAAVTFPGGKVTAVTPLDGIALNPAATAEAVLAGWPVRTAFDAVVTRTAPGVTPEEVTRALREFATPAMSGPVTLRIGAQRARLAPAAYAPAVSLTADATGALVPRLDPARLLAVIRKAAPDAERAAVNATVRLVDGRPAVIPARTGQKIDPARAAAAVLPALTSATRTATVPLVTAPPTVTTATARAWRIREVVSSFTSVFPTGATNAARTHNIGVAVRELNGTLVKPGEQFSLNRELGQRTAAKGYRQAPVIYDGRLTRDYGGGVSQVSTTVYNTAYFAGMRLDRHTPHSFYIPRYPEGREATVSWPDVDNAWTNDSGYGVLIQTWVSGNAVQMRFWGTKVWDIHSVKGPRRNITEPRKIVDDGESCVPQSPSPGFDVTVTRLFRRGGVTVKSDSFTTHYIPEDAVTCTNPRAG